MKKRFSVVDRATVTRLLGKVKEGGGREGEEEGLIPGQQQVVHQESAD